MCQASSDIDFFYLADTSDDKSAPIADWSSRCHPGGSTLADWSTGTVIHSLRCFLSSVASAATIVLFISRRRYGRAMDERTSCELRAILWRVAERTGRGKYSGKENTLGCNSQRGGMGGGG